MATKRGRTSLKASVFLVPRWGWMAIVAGDEGVVRILLPTGKGEAERFVKGLGAELTEGEPALEEAKGQILEYFAGRRHIFNLGLDWRGLSEFSRRALEACAQIPFGEVRSYRWVAERAGFPMAPRAIGRALASNPFPLVIPCHRVIKADGSLGGFSGPGGTALKRRLLQFEREVVGRWQRGGAPPERQREVSP
ncbi:MAG TPA: methylated-DNA--[protein]-cysteine S-methyltransferase [Armatimonadetes bacterium]|nr:methylated-DNA--[protein]-cysteine S-methyltransferase [Armatimonadota bacterium]